MIKRIFLIKYFFVFSIFSNIVHAGLLVEPYFGIGLLGQKWEEGGSENDKNTSGFGARLGFEIPGGLQAGLDLHSTDHELKNRSGGQNHDFSEFGIGGFIGYRTPLGPRFYASYFLSSELKQDNANNVKYDSGRGLRLGAGYILLNTVAFNVEFSSASYDDFQNSSGVIVDSDFELRNISFILSFPIHLN